jgi:acetolactate synthase-1/2/3 large subunit
LAHRYWADADVVVGIGSRMEWPLGDWGTKGLQLVHVNVDADEINRRGATTVGLCGDAAAIVPALVEGLRASGAVRPDRTAQLAAAKAEFLTTLAHLEPQRSYLAAIHDALPADGVMVEDVTQVTFAAHLLYPFSQPRTFLSTGVSGTLGSGLALAIGAQRALPSRQVLAVCGDGGFLFTATELATAVQHDIPVTAIVFDDGAYGNVKLFQTTRFGADRTIASDLVNPDFVAFARSFGAWAERAESPDELRTVLARALAHDGPALVHVPVGPMASAWPHLRLGPARLPEPSST